MNVDFSETDQNPNHLQFTVNGNIVCFQQIPSVPVEFYTVGGEFVAVFKPAESITLDFTGGVYVIVVDNYRRIIEIE